MWYLLFLVVTLASGVYLGEFCQEIWSYTIPVNMLQVKYLKDTQVLKDNIQRVYPDVQFKHEIVGSNYTLLACYQENFCGVIYRAPILNEFFLTEQYLELARNEHHPATFHMYIDNGHFKIIAC